MEQLHFPQNRILHKYQNTGIRTKSCIKNALKFKSYFIALSIVFFILASCGGNPQPATNSHTHADGTTHTHADGKDHPHAHSPEQESFEVNETEHSHHEDGDHHHPHSSDKKNEVHTHTH